MHPCCRAAPALASRLDEGWDGDLRRALAAEAVIASWMELQYHTSSGAALSVGRPCRQLGEPGTKLSSLQMGSFPFKPCKSCHARRPATRRHDTRPTSSAHLQPPPAQTASAPVWPPAGRAGGACVGTCAVPLRASHCLCIRAAPPGTCSSRSRSVMGASAPESACMQHVHQAKHHPPGRTASVPSPLEPQSGTGPTGLPPGRQPQSCLDK